MSGRTERRYLAAILAAAVFGYCALGVMVTITMLNLAAGY